MGQVTERYGLRCTVITANRHNRASVIQTGLVWSGLLSCRCRHGDQIADRISRQTVQASERVAYEYDYGNIFTASWSTSIEIWQFDDEHNTDAAARCDTHLVHQASKADTPCFRPRSKGESHSYRSRLSLTLIRPHLTRVANSRHDDVRPSDAFARRTYGRKTILVLLESRDASIVRSRSHPPRDGTLLDYDVFSIRGR